MNKEGRTCTDSADDDDDEDDADEDEPAIPLLFVSAGLLLLLLSTAAAVRIVFIALAPKVSNATSGPALIMASGLSAPNVLAKT